MAASWKTAFTLSKRERTLAAKAIGFLVLFSWRQKFVPIDRWQHLLGVPGPAGSLPPQNVFSPSPSSTDPESLIVKSISRACTLLPYTPSCLAQAGAGLALLRQEGEVGHVVIGLQKPAGEEKTWPAHAWLVTESGILTGGTVVGDFVPTTLFSPPGK